MQNIFPKVSQHEVNILKKKHAQKLLSRQVSIRVPKMSDFGTPSDPLGRVLVQAPA